MVNVRLHEIVLLPLQRILRKCFVICAALAVQSSTGCGVCTHPHQQEGLKLQGSLGTLKGETRGKQDGW